MVGGLFRIVGSLAGRFHGRNWVLMNGIITLILGIMIWQQMPFSGLWVIRNIPRNQAPDLQRLVVRHARPPASVSQPD